MADTVWVLTSSYNGYNRNGPVLETVFKTKPTLKELAEWFKFTSGGSYSNPMGALDFLMHIQSGGGRQGFEDHWYELNEVKFDSKNNGE